MIVLDAASKARAHQYTILIYLYFHEHKTLSPSSRKKKGNSITVHIPPPPNNKICDVAVLSRSLPVIGDVNLALMGRARARNVESISSSINEQLL